MSDASHSDEESSFEVLTIMLHVPHLCTIHMQVTMDKICRDKQL